MTVRMRDLSQVAHVSYVLGQQNLLRSQILRLEPQRSDVFQSLITLQLVPLDRAVQDFDPI